MAEPEFEYERSSLNLNRHRNIFVGRKREMETLTTVLDDCLAGQDRLVMLAGEPGIGKTRTALELASQAEKRGMQVLWGWCYEEDGAPPYWPWVQPIRSYVKQTDSDRLRSEMGPGAAIIAEIVPEIRAKLPGLESPPKLEPEQARFRLFDSITTFLKNASQSRPLMLVLDDLHWADKSSLLLLQFLAQGSAQEPAQAQPGCLLVLGCYRDAELSRQHPLSDTIALLSRSAGEGFQRVSLRGLDQDDTARFIEASIGKKPTVGLAEALYSHTEGNPFFITEVIRLLSESGELTAGGIGTPEALTIPEGVRTVIGQRLNRLSEQCNQALTTASMIGREFDFQLLDILISEMSEDQLLQAVDEAVSYHLIEDVPGQMDRYQFSHALIQQTLAEEVSTSRRVRLHARIAEALEELYGDDVETHAAELAHHYSEARTVLGTEMLVRYSLLAGERALASHAGEDALAYFERGLLARGIDVSGTEAAADEQAAALLFGLARAKSLTGVGHQFGEAFANLSRAFDYYVEAGDVVLVVAAAEFHIAPPGHLIPGLSQLIARALTLVPTDSHEAGRLLSHYGGIVGNAEGDYEGAQHAFGRAISISRLKGDVALEMQTLAYIASVSGRHLRWQESVDSGLRAIELAIVNENPFYELFSRHFTTLSLLGMGDLDRARPHTLVMRDLAERRSAQRQLASMSLMVITSLSCLEGDWTAGRETSDRSLELSPLNPQLLAPRALLEHETGETAQGEAYLERLLEAMRWDGPDQLIGSGRTSMAITAIARITGVLDRLELAEAAARAILSEPSVSPNIAMSARGALALLAVQQGDRSGAEQHYAYLIGQRSTMINTVSSVDRLLGLLSQTMGDLDQAVAHFEDGLIFCSRAGYRPELAWTSYDYAELLVRAGFKPASTGANQAMSLMDQALTISTDLGMRPITEKLIALKAEALGRAVPVPFNAPAYPAGLTVREIEVLRLIVQGKTTREIACELVLSPRTVQRHISNLYAKIGVRNRVEATAFALIEPSITPQPSPTT